MKATARILEIYNANRLKLSHERAKTNKDKACLNAIAAYEHILSHMERVYNLTRES